MTRSGGARERAGDEKLAAAVVAGKTRRTIAVSSPAFQHGARLPESAGAAGGGVAPAITWRNVPPGTRSVVLLCEDPDAPAREPFVHWIVYGLPGGDGGVDPDRAREGLNGRGEEGFTGAAPPRGHGVHHYHFQVFALDAPLELEAGAGRAAVLDAMKGHVLGWGELMGTYETR